MWNLVLNFLFLLLSAARSEETCGKNSCVPLVQLILLENKKLHNINVFSSIPSSPII